MLHSVSKGFLHDAEQREFGAARYDAGAFFGVACDRNTAGGALNSSQKFCTALGNPLSCRSGVCKS
jgi:hypothetical protein